MTALADPAMAGNDEDVIEIDGEEYSKAELEDFRNNEKWKRSNEEESTALKRSSETLEAEKASVAERERLLAVKERELLERKPEVDDPEDDYEINTVDDPEGAARLIKEQGDAIKQMRTELKGVREDLGSRVAEVNARTDEKISRGSARDRAFDKNDDMIQKYFEAHPEVSDTQRDKIVQHMDDNMRVPDPEMGAMENGVFVFQTNAMEASDRWVRRDHYAKQAEEIGYQKAVDDLKEGGDATSHTGVGGVGRIPRVGKDATGEDIWTAAQDVRGGAPALEKFVDQLSGDQLTAYMRADRRRQLQEAGEV